MKVTVTLFERKEENLSVSVDTKEQKTEYPHSAYIAVGDEDACFGSICIPLETFDELMSKLQQRRK